MIHLLRSVRMFLGLFQKLCHDSFHELYFRLLYICLLNCWQILYHMFFPGRTYRPLRGAVSFENRIRISPVIAIPDYSGRIISSFIGTNPAFSYRGLPMGVASSVIKLTPLAFASLISSSSIFRAIPCLLYSGLVYIFMI